MTSGSSSRPASSACSARNWCRSASPPPRAANAAASRSRSATANSPPWSCTAASLSPFVSASWKPQRPMNVGSTVTSRACSGRAGSAHRSTCASTRAPRSRGFFIPDYWRATSSRRSVPPAAACDSRPIPRTPRCACGSGWNMITPWCGSKSVDHGCIAEAGAVRSASRRCARRSRARRCGRQVGRRRPTAKRTSPTRVVALARC